VDHVVIVRSWRARPGVFTTPYERAHRRRRVQVPLEEFIFPIVQAGFLNRTKRLRRVTVSGRRTPSIWRYAWR
jgi:hypothetical protein